ncbi:hypothetical protein QPK87_23820 [Kamptonema cortianum]|nr:hypothetical protein [Oscillatoria laete-virens]MDK3159579.1 hypothetical protein [Kamptonema cortianum]MDL5053285.1 hypothetical protein [Oscillatoria laete-virens NRMC-F 0139]
MFESRSPIFLTPIKRNSPHESSFPAVHRQKYSLHPDPPSARALDIRAGVGEGTFLAAVSDRISGWETFEMADLGGGRFSLKSVQNGKFIRAGVGQDTLLAAVSDRVAGWETFIRE